jgi:hypothetical protein
VKKQNLYHEQYVFLVEPLMRERQVDEVLPWPLEEQLVIVVAPDFLVVQEVPASASEGAINARIRMKAFTGLLRIPDRRCRAAGPFRPRRPRAP